MKAACLLAAMLAAADPGSAAAQGTLDYPSVWRCDQSKFNWYCDDEAPAARLDPPAAAAQPPAAPAAPAASPRRLELKDIRTAAQMREELKRREDLAVMDASDQNLKDYLELWQAAQEKGAVFADTWRRVVWTTPEFDYSLRRPVNNAAIRAYDAEREGTGEQQLRALAAHHGLIFFFRSDCPYCHAMAPVVKLLSQRYGIEVLGVSVDGRGLPDFPNPRDGRQQAAAWGVERVPALFIGSKETGDRAPIGFGTMALTDIIQRILVLTGTRPGDSF